MIVRDLRADDWPAVRAIYEVGIRSGNATFETEAPSWEDWDAAHPTLRLVAERDGSVVGWAALSPASSRPCYRGVGGVSVYVAADARGEGIGRALLERLVERSEQEGYWTLTAGVFPENEASLGLHRAFAVEPRGGSLPFRVTRQVSPAKGLGSIASSASRTPRS